MAAIPSVSQPEGRPRAATLAVVALAGVVVYVAIDALLAFLRPDYSLLYNAESDYGRGPWFWVMDLNFLLRCALSLAAVGALARAAAPDARPWIGLALLGSATGHKHAPGGLYERIFLGLELLWIAVAAAHIATMRSPRSSHTARDAQATLPAARRMQGSA